MAHLNSFSSLENKFPDNAYPTGPSGGDPAAKEPCSATGREGCAGFAHRGGCKPLLGSGEKSMRSGRVGLS